MCAWNSKLNLRVERDIHTLVLIVKEVDLEAELGGADTDSHGVVRFLRARQRESNFHLGRKLMTEDLGQNSSLTRFIVARWVDRAYRKHGHWVLTLRAFNKRQWLATGRRIGYADQPREEP